MKNLLRTLLIGKYNYLPNWAEYKIAILRGQLSLLCFLIAALYIVLDLYIGVTIFLPSYSAVMVICVIALLLNRWKKYEMASFSYLLLLNVMTYVFATNDVSYTGVFIYFLMCAIMAVAFYGYTNRIYAFLFCGLSLFLFLSSYLFPAEFVVFSGEDMNVINSSEYRVVSFVFNFVAGSTLCVLIVYFLIDLNYHSEKETLAKNELLAKTNKELDRFVYSASHDLRAPLTSLLGLIEITGKTDDPEEVKQCLEMMKDRIHNLDDFIKEIIDFSRNARQEVRKEKVKVLDLIKETVDDLKFAEGLEEIFIKYTIDPALEVITDRARLKVIFNNLIGNAFKYRDPDKTNQEVSVQARPYQSQIQIDIGDNGIGISREHQEKIFDMFYRATEKSSGSGLGLYIVRETLAKLSGHITVNSTPGQGTTFHLSIPLSPVA